MSESFDKVWDEMKADSIIEESEQESRLERMTRKLYESQLEKESKDNVEIRTSAIDSSSRLERMNRKLHESAFEKVSKTISE